MPPLARNVLLLAALLPVVAGCAVVVVTGAVVGAGVSVASTAVDVAVGVGKGVVKVGGAIVGADEEEKK